MSPRPYIAVDYGISDRLADACQPAPGSGVIDPGPCRLMIPAAQPPGG